MKVVVAVSGGVDSVVLLDLLAKKKLDKFLKRNSPKTEITGIAHFNHKIHREANAHEKFVENLAKKYRLPFFSKRSSRKLRSEAEARDSRFEFLETILEKNGADMIVLAQHFDDQVETILLNIVRGTGLLGLSGMTEFSRKKWRPLLEIPKVKIIAFAKKTKLKFVDDPTNFDSNYSRNFLRLEILPKLKKLNPRMGASILRLARQARENVELINLLADDFLKKAENTKSLPIIEFRILPSAIAKAVIREIYFREIGNLQKIEELHVSEILELGQNPAGGKQKKLGKLIFKTSKIGNRRVLSWK